MNDQIFHASLPEIRSNLFSRRQQAVLECAIELFVDSDRGLTTAALARAASCSKESLYKWFGNRHDLLAAMMAYRASKVRTLLIGGQRMRLEQLKLSLTIFSQDLLDLLSDDLLVAAARTDTPMDVTRLLKSCFEHIEARAKVLLEQGERAGLLRMDSRDTAYRALFGLIAADLPTRRLLGAVLKKDPGQARWAVDAFTRLYCVRRNGNPGE